MDGLGAVPPVAGWGHGSGRRPEDGGEGVSDVWFGGGQVGPVDGDEGAVCSGGDVVGVDVDVAGSRRVGVPAGGGGGPVAEAVLVAARVDPEVGEGLVVEPVGGVGGVGPAGGVGRIEAGVPVAGGDLGDLGDEVEDLVDGGDVGSGAGHERRSEPGLGRVEVLDDEDGPFGVVGGGGGDEGGGDAGPVEVPVDGDLVGEFGGGVSPVTGGSGRRDRLGEHEPVGAPPPSDPQPVR